RATRPESRSTRKARRRSWFFIVIPHFRGERHRLSPADKSKSRHDRENLLWRWRSVPLLLGKNLWRDVVLHRRTGRGLRALIFGFLRAVRQRWQAGLRGERLQGSFWSH